MRIIDSIKRYIGLDCEKDANHAQILEPAVVEPLSREELSRQFLSALQNAYGDYLPPFEDVLYTRWCYLVAAGKLLCPEYRFKWPQLDWWNNQAFTDYLALIGEKDGFNADRRWTAGQLVRLVANVSGDMVECGVYKGGTAFLLLDECLRSNKHLHLFDSFEGLSVPLSVDGAHWSAGALEAQEADVHKLLSRYGTQTGYTCYKGWIPERFCEVEDLNFSFVHLDVDLYEPTRDSIGFFYPRMSQGAICICDDYACTTCPGATKAVDEFLADKPEKMLSLCAGGGFFVKGTLTSFNGAG